MSSFTAQEQVNKNMKEATDLFEKEIQEAINNILASRELSSKSTVIINLTEEDAKILANEVFQRITHLQDNQALSIVLGATNTGVGVIFPHGGNKLALLGLALAGCSICCRDILQEYAREGKNIQNFSAFCSEIFKIARESIQTLYSKNL
jgi:hypothetical protein